MGLQLSKTLLNGSAGNYWKITQANISKELNSVEYTITLFKEKSFSDASLPGIGESKAYTKEGCTSQELEGDIIAMGYAHIKSVDVELSLAVDV